MKAESDDQLIIGHGAGLMQYPLAYSLQLQRRHEYLAASESERLRAIAQFPLEVFTVARDLNAIMCLQESSGIEISDDALNAARHMAALIQDRYREIFGRELFGPER